MLKVITLAIALLVVPAVSPSGQDFDKGGTAYESGDYATALREWTPLAEQTLELRLLKKSMIADGGDDE